MGGDVHERVLAALTASGTSFTVHRHADFPVPILRPEDVAGCLGYDADRIVKTLFLRVEGAAPEAGFCLVSVPAPRRVSLESAARAVGAVSAALASQGELRRGVGYPARGVSPLGAGPHPVLLDRRLLAFPTLLVGAGVVGVDLELPTEALLDLTTPKLVDACE